MNDLDNKSASEYAVVSPCSTCQNYAKGLPGTGTPTINDKFRTPCPRLLWQTQNQISTQSNGVLTPPQDYLSATGTKYPNVLANPLQPTNDILLIWTAAVQDNHAIVDDKGNLLNPGITEGPDKFDTTYIHCRNLPYLPEHDSATFQLFGYYQAWDQAYITNGRLEMLLNDGQGNPAKMLVGGHINHTHFPKFYKPTPNLPNVINGI